MEFGTSIDTKNTNLTAVRYTFYCDTNIYCTYREIGPFHIGRAAAVEMSLGRVRIIGRKHVKCFVMWITCESACMLELRDGPCREFYLLGERIFDLS